MLHKSGWESVKNDLQNQLQKMIDRCQELEREVINLKSENIVTIKKAEEDINQTKMKILSEKVKCSVHKKLKNLFLKMFFFQFVFLFPNFWHFFFYSWML